MAYLPHVHAVGVSRRKIPDRKIRKSRRVRHGRIGASLGARACRVLESDSHVRDSVEVLVHHFEVEPAGLGNLKVKGCTCPTVAWDKVRRLAWNDALSRTSRVVHDYRMVPDRQGTSGNSLAHAPGRLGAGVPPVIVQVASRIGEPEIGVVIRIPRAILSGIVPSGHWVRTHISAARIGSRRPSRDQVPGENAQHYHEGSTYVSTNP